MLVWRHNAAIGGGQPDRATASVALTDLSGLASRGTRGFTRSPLIVRRHSGGVRGTVRGGHAQSVFASCRQPAVMTVRPSARANASPRLLTQGLYAFWKTWTILACHK